MKFVEANEDMGQTNYIGNFKLCGAFVVFESKYLSVHHAPGIIKIRGRLVERDRKIGNMVKI